MPLNDRQALQAAAATAPQLAVGRSRDVALDPAYLAATIAPEGVDQLQDRLSRAPAPATVRIELFPGLVVDLERTSISEAFGGGFIWTGESRGQGTAWADLVIRNGMISGNITVLGAEPRNYRIDPLAVDRMHRISELDSSAFPPEGHPVSDGHDHDHDHGHDHGDGHDDDDGHDAHEDAMLHEGTESSPASQTPTPASTVTQIDVLVAYTSAAAASTADIISQANLAISQANSAFTRSNVLIQYRLVGTPLVSGYAETDFSTMLSQLRAGTLAAFQPIHALRNSAGADLVAMLVSGTQYCGIGYVPPMPSPSTSDTGFSVTAVSCISNHSFAHELGHNMGVNHDRYVVSPQPPSSAYQYGFVSVPGRFRTVMAYNNACTAAGVSCTRINSFSNPLLTYEGRATGIPAGTAGAADATRWLNEVRAAVAAYRPTVGGTTPPNNLFANRILIAAPGTVTGTNVGATSEPGQPTIGVANSSNAVWWRYTPGLSGTLTINTCGSNFDTTLAVFTGAAVNALTRVTQNDDSCGTQSRVSFPAVGGVQYQIAVAGYNNATGNITLGVEFVPAAAATTTSLSAPSTGLVGQSLTFSATVASGGGTPSGTVSFRRDGTEFATGTLNGAGVASVSSSSIPQGSHQITAHYLGNASFAASASSAQTLTISPAQAMTSTSLSAPSAGTLGDFLTFTATVTSSGGTPNGMVSFRRNGSQFATGTLNGAGVASVADNSFPEGTHEVTAHYLGNASFASSDSWPAYVTISWSQASTMTSLDAPSTGIVGQSLSFSATVTSPGGTPNGTVSFRRNGSEFATGMLNGSGMATVSDNTLSEGSHQITAHYLGNANFAASTSAQRTVVISGVPSLQAHITAGRHHNCAVAGDQSVYCWGRNNNGQVGNGSTINQTVPVNVSGLPAALQVGTNMRHTCAVRPNGSVACWGWNAAGQLGDRTTQDRRRPVRVVGVGRVTQVATGMSHSCALRDNGVVWCWGGNDTGQLGDGTTTNRPAPVRVAGLNGVTAITAGEHHTCALRNNGAVMCWGGNDMGQIGDGTNTLRRFPVRVSRLQQVTQISAGLDHTCALREDAAVYCWGANGQGQLGDGTVATRRLPVRTTGLSAVQVAAGETHSCAVRITGYVACWGANNSGQIGDSTTRDRRRPVNVLTLGLSTQVAAGGSHTCALRDTGRVYCWGGNGAGQLGDGTTTGQLTPVMVNLRPLTN